MTKRILMIAGSIVLVLVLLYACGKITERTIGSSSANSMAARFQDSMGGLSSSSSGSTGSSQASSTSTNVGDANSASGSSTLTTGGVPQAGIRIQQAEPEQPWPFCMFNWSNAAGTHSWTDDKTNQDVTSTITTTPETAASSAPFFTGLAEVVKDSNNNILWQQTLAYSNGPDGENDWPSSWTSPDYKDINTAEADDYIDVTHINSQRGQADSHSFRIYMNGIQRNVWVSQFDGGICVQYGRFDNTAQTFTYTETMTWPATSPMAGSIRTASGTFYNRTATRTGSGESTFTMTTYMGGKKTFYESGTQQFREPSGGWTENTPGYHKETGTRTKYDQNGNETSTENFTFIGHETGTEESTMTMNPGTADETVMVSTSTKDATYIYRSETMTLTDGSYKLSENSMKMPLSAMKDMKEGGQMGGVAAPAGTTMVMTMYPSPNIPAGVKADDPFRHVIRVEQTFITPEAQADGREKCASGSMYDLGVDGSAAATKLADVTLYKNGDIHLAFTDGSTADFNVFQDDKKGGPPPPTAWHLMRKIFYA